MTSVSVALASYNGARYLEEQLASILTGTRLPDEIVVSDDGSTDATGDILRAAAHGSPVPMRILGNPGPHGVVPNFVNAMSACASEVILLSDQDDVWMPNRLEDSIASLEAHPDALLVHGDALLVDAGRQALGWSLFEALGVDGAVRGRIRGGHAFATFLRRNLATGATIAFRRGLLEDALPIAPEWVHDEWLAVLAAAREAVVVLDAPVIEYRQHGANQIGVEAPTLRSRVKRLAEPDAGRTARLARRSEALAERLERRGAAPATIASARAKARFEGQRSALSPRRLRRLVPVARLAATGAYARYASQGTLDVVRDLVQPR